jgi:hypothetical protein
MKASKGWANAHRSPLVAAKGCVDLPNPIVDTPRWVCEDFSGIHSSLSGRDLFTCFVS